MIPDTMCTHLHHVHALDAAGFRTPISRSVAHLRWKATGPCLSREREMAVIFLLVSLRLTTAFILCARVAVILGTIFIVLPVVRRFFACLPILLANTYILTFWRADALQIFLAVGYVAGVIPNPFEVCVQGGSDC